MATAIQNITPGSAGGSSSHISNCTYSQTVSAGGNAGYSVLVVAIGSMANSATDTPTPTGVTFGGVALTEGVGRASASSNKNGYGGLWYLLNPSVSTANIIISFTPSTGALSCVAESYVLTDVKQQAPEASNSGGLKSLNITSVTANAWLVDAICDEGTSANVASGTNQSLISSASIGTTAANGQMTLTASRITGTTAGSYTLNYSTTPNAPVNHVALSWAVLPSPTAKTISKAVTGTATDVKKPAKIIAATSTHTVTRTRLIEMARRASSASSTALLHYKGRIQSLTASASHVVSAVKRVCMIRVASISKSVSSSKSIGMTRTASVSSSSIVSKLKTYAVAVTAASSGVARKSRNIFIIMAATSANFSRSIKSISRSMRISSAGSAVISTYRALLHSMAASISTSSIIIPSQRLRFIAQSAPTATINIIRSLCQSVTVAVSNAVTMAREIGLSMSAQESSDASTAISRGTITLLTAAASSSANFVREIRKIRLASSSAALTVERNYHRMMAASATSIASMVKKIGIARRAVSSSAASIFKRIPVFLSTSSTADSVLTYRFTTLVTLFASSVLNVTLSRLFRLRLHILSSSMTSMRRSLRMLFIISSAVAVSAIRRISKHASTNISSVAVLKRDFHLRLITSISSLAIFSRVLFKRVVVSVTAIPHMRRRISKSFVVVSSGTAEFIRRLHMRMSITASATVAIQHQFQLILLGTVTSAFSITKILGVRLYTPSISHAFSVLRALFALRPNKARTITLKRRRRIITLDDQT